MRLDSILGLLATLLVVVFVVEALWALSIAAAENQVALSLVLVAVVVGILVGTGAASTTKTGTTYW